MTRHLCAGLLLLMGTLMLAGCGGGGGGSTSTEPYYLTWMYREGAWATSTGTYSVTLKNASGQTSYASEGTMEETDTVLRQEQVAGLVTWVVSSTVHYHGGTLDGRQSTITQWLDARAEGLWCCAYQTIQPQMRVFAEPLLCLPNPLVPGTVFVPSGTFPVEYDEGRLISCSAKISGLETLTVPAGQYLAMKIVGSSETERTDALGQTYRVKATQTYWVEATDGTVRSTQTSTGYYDNGGRAVTKVDLHLAAKAPSHQAGALPALGNGARLAAAQALAVASAR